MTSPDAHTIAHIAKWLIDLADLTRHANEDKPSKSKLAVYAEMLAGDFPGTAFTRSSLHWVVQGKEFFPAYEVIRSTLSAWWIVNRPASPALAIADEAFMAMTPTDRLWVNHWRKRKGEIWAERKDPLADHPDDAKRAQSKMGRLKSLVRTNSPAAWAYISRAEGLDDGNDVVVPFDARRILASLTTTIRSADSELRTAPTNA